MNTIGRVARRQLFRLLIAISAFSALAAAQTGEVPAQPTSVEGATSHVYKSIGGVELRLHVFSPASKASGRLPAIVFFFGGGWTRGNIEQFVPQSKYLVERGMVAIVADYRVFGRHKTSPFEAIADAKSAIRWVRSHAKELGIDPGRIVAAGGSSGGHIALCSAVLDDFDEKDENKRVSSKPNALVLFNPVAYLPPDPPRGVNDLFLGRSAEASPQQHLRRGLPPTVIFHGKADEAVPYATAEKFCLDSTKLGNKCYLFGYEGATHGFFNPSNAEGKWYRETLNETDRFLTGIGYLPKAASSTTSR